MSLKRYEGKIAGSYDLEETIGKGHFAVVKLARHVYSGEKVAVKVIDKNKLDEVSKAHLFQEVGCMKLVQHPNVVRLYEVIDTPSKLYLIMELGDGGDMYDFISRHSQGLEEETARRYFRQVTHAINYCHQLHVVHRDLKLENVVIFEKLGIVKLTDFGFSNKFIPGSKLETSCGSLAYSAPEILLGDSYDAPAVDVWSLGVILYMLVCGQLPFQEANDSETLTKIMDCSYHLPPHISPECRDLISLMLVRDPHKRITLSGILSHVWQTRGDPAPLPLLPLITWEHLTQEEHSQIINKMVARKMASKDEILQALEQNAYNHITATYYLLAESRLRKQRERAAHMGHRSNQGSPLGGMGSPPGLSPIGPVDPKAKLAPLALSPRLPAPDSSPDTPDSVVSPLGGGLPRMVVSPPDGGLTGTVVPPPPRRTTRSPTDRKVLRRKCSLIQEEVLEEEEMDVDGDVVANRPSHTEESLSDDSDSRSTAGTRDGASRGRSAPPPRRQLPVRPLHSVRSSPQLLQIHEEASGDDDDILLPLATRTPEGPLRNKRLSPRGHATNYSSSDTSDTDDTDARRHRHQRGGDRLKGRLQRRDSSENSSDTDGGPGAGVRNPGTAPGRLWSSRPHRPTDKNRSKSSSNNSNKTTGGRQNNTGAVPGQNNASPSQTSLLGKRDSSSDRDNSHNEIGCKMSNISISSSNKSSGSGGRGQKYVSEDDKVKDVEAALNEENKAKSRIIHVRSKNFSDLMERFSASKQQGAVDEPGTLYGGQMPATQDIPAANKLRNRRTQQRIKTDINRNGLIAGRDESEGEPALEPTPQTSINSVRTKCCSVV